MRVLLVQTEMNPGNRGSVFYFGPAAISAYLKEKGHDVHFRIVNNTILDKEDFLSEIQSMDPGLIGFSVMTDEWIYVSKLAAWIKERFEIPIICGGAHPTVAPEEVIQDKNVDMLCRGEGEYAIEELCACLDEERDCRRIQNLWVKDGGKVFTNPVRPLIEDLNELPLPDTEMLDFRKIVRENKYVARFMVGRGCPFNCSYCVNSVIHKLYRGKGQRVRRMSPERVIEGLKAVTEKYPEIAGLGFDDDTFSLDKDWLKRFSRLYKRELGLPFVCYMRIEGIDHEFLEIICDAGGAAIDIGLESGNEWLRKNILNRKMSNEEIVEKFRLTKEFAIETTSLNMIGLPFETREMIEETIELNKKIEPTWIIAQPFQPYPGIQLRELCIENGWLANDQIKFIDRRESILNLPHLTRAEISDYVRRLNHLGYAMMAENYPAGIYDFLSHLKDAVIEQDKESRVEVTIFKITDELALRACPPSRVSYLLRIPPDTMLSFDIGMNEETYNKPGDGVFFLIEVEYGNEFHLKDRIFFRYINPRRNEKERGWLHFQLALTKYFNKEVRLSFITRPGPYPIDCWRDAGWRRPHLCRISAGKKSD